MEVPPFSMSRPGRPTGAALTVDTTKFSYPVGRKLEAGEGSSAGAWKLVFSEQERLGWSCWVRPLASDVLLRQLSGRPFAFDTGAVGAEASSEGGFNDVKTSLLRFVVPVADR